MTKDKLQQELLAKVKEGVKPSDLKKPSQKLNKKAISPPPMEISKSDEGYKSDASNKLVPIAPPLPNNQDLKNQVLSLQKQLQLYKDFREGDLKVKEGYKQELTEKNKTLTNLQQKNSELTKTIATMKSEAKNQAEPKENKTFTCADCNEEKPQSELSRVFGKFSFCLECSKRARQEAGKQKEAKPQPEQFTCHLCEQTKQEIPNLMKLDQTLTEYSVCSSCKPLAKEFNEADLITDDLWEKYPYSSASEILELEFGIKPKEVKPW